jgi:hypothetical protein
METHLILKDTEGQALATKTLFRTPVEEMDAEDVATVYAYLDQLEKAISARRNSLKARLHQECAERVAESTTQLPAQRMIRADSATTTKSGSQEITLLGIKVTRQRRVTRKINVHRLLAMLDEKGLDPEVAGKSSFVLDENKVENLVANGVISPAELSSVVDEEESWAMKVTPSNDMLEVIQRGLQ